VKLCRRWPAALGEKRKIAFQAGNYNTKMNRKLLLPAGFGLGYACGLKI
jgi:hypothetical protein